MFTEAVSQSNKRPKNNGGKGSVAVIDRIPDNPVAYFTIFSRQNPIRFYGSPPTWRTIALRAILEMCVTSHEKFGNVRDQHKV